MDKIQVKVIDEHKDPGGMMMFLAKLTQRGHNIKSMDDLLSLYNSSAFPKASTVGTVAQLPHGTIKRFAPITVAIVGASRRFLAQARTNQVGFTYVSASLQYSDYSGKADFVVPYALIEADYADRQADPDLPEGLQNLNSGRYLESCQKSMETYRIIAESTDNDTAGYAAPQGLRNILIMQGNHQAWDYFIRLRSCHRNTNETQYVTLRIWEELLKTENGKEFFKYAGPDCAFGVCREGKMCCGRPVRQLAKQAIEDDKSLPRLMLEEGWPLLYG